MPSPIRSNYLNVTGTVSYLVPCKTDEDSHAVIDEHNILSIYLLIGTPRAYNHVSITLVSQNRAHTFTKHGHHRQ
jgi:hypothetical protein